MAERVLGLDVGTSAVRVVEVAFDHPGGRGRRHPGGPAATVTRVGEVPLAAGAVRDGEVVDPTAVGAAISELWRQTGLRSRDVRVGLTGSRVVVRVIDMPSMPDDELEGAVRFSAADRSSLDGLLAAVSAGGLRAVAVDLVPFALVRALTTAGAESPEPVQDGPLEEGGPTWP